MFNKFGKIILVTPILIVGIFAFHNTYAASITIQSFNVTPNSIPTGRESALSAYMRLSGTAADCGNNTDLNWYITNGDSFQNISATGKIRYYELPYVNNFQFPFTPSQNQTVANFQLRIFCDRFLPILDNQITASAVEPVNVTGQQAGPVEIRFGSDKTNQRVTPGSQVTINFTLSFTSKMADLQAVCTNTAMGWSVFVYPLSDPSKTTTVKSGGISLGEFGTGKTIDKNFPLSFTALNEDFGFKARAECDRRFGSDELVVSSQLRIISGGAGPGVGAVCGNNKCESEETQTSCPADCKPGQDQIYPFEITNPLKGGADDFTSLVKILAQWIFNLAIPIAVAMIVYSGILFLTAAGEPAKVTKARDVLKYAIIGLAIILIGSGFVTLIQSVLKLGGTETTQDQGPGLPVGPQLPTSAGTFGNKCSKDSNCLNGLICKNTICQRRNGNLAGEPCVAGASCDVGLACDKSGQNTQVIDGQTLGTCFQTSASGGRIGDICQRDSNCISGLKCNQICQRKDGNLNGEVCLKTSNPSNCQSKACHTIGTAVDGDCVPYSGT